MRRTTICRSNCAAVLALAALPVLWRVLPAQVTTHAAVVPMDTIPADTTQLIVEPPPPTVVETNETIFDRRRTNQQVVQDVLRAYVHQPYRPVRAGEFYAAGFLSEAQRLPWGQVVGATATPAIHRLSERTSATTFQEIAIKPPRNASYHVGDSLLLARLDPGLNFGNWGDVVYPIGIARVTSIEKNQVLSEV